MAMQPEIRYINSYVSGNVAYQPKKKPQKQPAVQLPKAKKQQKYVFPVDIMAVCGIFTALVLSIMLMVGVTQMFQAQQEAKQMKQYALSLQEENAQLREIYEASYDLEEIRQIALAMGMVPVEDVTHLQVQLSAPEEVQEYTAWESFCAFMVGLFA